MWGLCGSWRRRAGRFGAARQGVRRGAPLPGSDAGYALTDALVATLILASTLVLGMQALGQAREAADVASEYRRAEALTRHLIETAPHRYETRAGESDGFRWSVETSITGAERPIEICRRAVALHNERSGRDYQTATLRICPVGLPS